VISILCKALPLVATLLSLELQYQWQMMFPLVALEQVPSLERQGLGS
jgi:hypothetical protein